MITHYFKSLQSSSMRELDKYKAGSWIYAVNPSMNELAELANKRDLDLSLLQDALDEDEMPRMEHEKGTTYLFTRFAHTTEDLQIVTAPLLIVIDEKFVLTISTQALPRLEKFVTGKIDFSTTQRTKLVLQILDQIVDQYEYYLSNISRQIKSIRSRLRVEEIRNKDFIQFVTIEDELNEFLSALIPTNAILRRLLLGKHISLFEEDEDLVEDLLLNNEQSIEGCRSSLKSIVNIREAYSTIMTNNLNRVIRLLTIVTLLLSVPTLIASVYGMNVDLPFAGEPFAFGGVMLFSFMISILFLLWFKFKHWI